MNTMLKKSILVCSLLAANAVSLYAESELVAEISWYEQEYNQGRLKNDIVSLLDVLMEEYGHNPEDGQAFDTAIEFFISKGVDINQTFNLVEGIYTIYGTNVGKAQAVINGIPKSLTVPSVTLLITVANSEFGYLVQSLLKHGAAIVVDSMNVLDFWVAQYKEFESDYAPYINSEFEENAIVFNGLRYLFDAADAQLQEEFLQKYPEFKIIVQKQK